jgi:CRP/FNR family transcriptional regulator, cyclic AMP receptor protein
MSTPAYERMARDPAFQELFTSGHRRRYARNDVIVREGEVGRSLYFIMSGSVAVRLSDLRGEETPLAYRYAGDFFGEMCLFPGPQARTAMIQARSECLVLEIPYQRFLDLTRKHTSLWLELAGQLAARLRDTNRRLAEMPLLRAAERIWSVIAEVAEHAEAPRKGDGIPLRMTRAEIGKLAGCSRELAGMALKDLERMGSIRLSGQTIIVAREALAGRRAAGVPPPQP